jgi:linoleoyl-CoA desaturase
MKQKPKVKFANKDRSKFFGVLRSNVDAYFVENNISKYANGSMVFKTVVMLFLYIAPLASLMVFHQETWQLVISFSIVGLAMAGIGMNVMHDANHNASPPFALIVG